MFLHGNSDTETFFLFFQHLAGKLLHTGTAPIIGSDEEKAMTNAIQMAFAASFRLSCTRHLKQNFNAYLTDHARLTSGERKKVVNKLLRRRGLLERAKGHEELPPRWPCG